MGDLHEQFKGKSLSLYIVNVTGEYDSILPWPFTHCVSLTLIDQNPSQDGRINISKSVNFERLEHSPDTGKRKGWGGYGDFVTQSVLHSRSYIKNNTLCVIANVTKNK